MELQSICTLNAITTIARFEFRFIIGGNYGGSIGGEPMDDETSHTFDQCLRIRFNQWWILDVVAAFLLLFFFFNSRKGIFGESLGVVR